MCMHFRLFLQKKALIVITFDHFVACLVATEVGWSLELKVFIIDLRTLQSHVEI